MSAVEANARGLLDTSVVIRLHQLADPEQLPLDPVIATVTLAELAIGPAAATDEFSGIAGLTIVPVVVDRGSSG